MKISYFPLANFQLERYPIEQDNQLRAWDAADEFLLQHINEDQSFNTSSRVLILNDSFGVLTLALSKNQPVFGNDSFLSHQSCLFNLKLHSINKNEIQFCNSLQALQGMFDFVLIKLPKSSALLEFQLFQIREHINVKSKIITAGMSKNIHSSTLKLFERIVGETRTSLAQKKARLIYTTRNEKLNNGKSQYPKSFIFEADKKSFEIINHANVFSRDRLDNGSRFLLENLPQFERCDVIADLGCGNGVLGLLAAEQNKSARLIFSDESKMAVTSARINFEAAFGKKRNATFLQTDCLRGVEDDSVDLVLNNPPFHQQHTIHDSIMWKMFSDARRVLAEAGQLWVVANQHLGHHKKLKKLFGNCEMVTRNQKYVIFMAEKR